MKYTQIHAKHHETISLTDCIPLVGFEPTSIAATDLESVEFTIPPQGQLAVGRIELPSTVLETAILPLDDTARIGARGIEPLS